MPKTEYTITPVGRRALERYLDHMEALIKSTRNDSASVHAQLRHKANHRRSVGIRRHPRRDHHGRQRPLANARAMPRTAGHRAGVRPHARSSKSPPAPTSARSRSTPSRPTTGAGPRPKSRAHASCGARFQIESKRCLENGVRLSIIVGRRDRLPASLVVAIQEAEALTAHGRNLHLRVAIDYSARESIMQAASLANGEPMNRERFAALLAKVNHDPFPIRDVDLLVRTGGEQRLSDFLLWECAYAELYFTRGMWPEFTEKSSQRVERFQTRERRFGAVAAQVASHPRRARCRVEKSPRGSPTRMAAATPSSSSAKAASANAAGLASPIWRPSAGSLSPWGARIPWRPACRTPSSDALLPLLRGIEPSAHAHDARRHRRAGAAVPALESAGAHAGVARRSGRFKARLL